jgi:hypothetical protein
MTKTAPGRLTLAAAALVASLARPAAADEWTVWRSDPMGGPPQLVGVQLAEEPSFDSRGNEFWPSFLVRCSFGRIDAAINWQVPVSQQQGRAAVVVRLDGAPGLIESWMVDGDPALTARPDAGRWLERLLAVRRLSAAVTAADGARIDTSFDLQGLVDFAEEVEAVCGWKLVPD